MYRSKALDVLKRVRLCVLGFKGTSASRGYLVSIATELNPILAMLFSFQHALCSVRFKKGLMGLDSMPEAGT